MPHAQRKVTWTSVIIITLQAWIVLLQCKRTVFVEREHGNSQNNKENVTHRCNLIAVISKTEVQNFNKTDHSDNFPLNLSS